mmetsp:Transcript_26575/g.78193  ORF Transcript_26575/g.78193 Transcript_26575/m.78193 type:complete len:217 (+) Transcript_26575:704-1354(+)
MLPDPSSSKSLKASCRSASCLGEIESMERAVCADPCIFLRRLSCDWSAARILIVLMDRSSFTSRMVSSIMSGRLSVPTEVMTVSRPRMGITRPRTVSTQQKQIGKRKSRPRSLIGLRKTTRRPTMYTAARSSVDRRKCSRKSGPAPPVRKGKSCSCLSIPLTGVRLSKAGVAWRLPVSTCLRVASGGGLTLAWMRRTTTKSQIMAATSTRPKSVNT